MDQLKLPALAAAVVLLTHPAVAGETLRFQAPEGLRLAKTLRVNHELNMDETGSSSERSPFVREDIGGWLTSVTRLVVQDEYVAVGGGRPLVVRRLFKNVEGHGSITLTGGRTRLQEAASVASPLEGAAILCTWVEEEGDYSRCYDQITGDERNLLELRGDMDLLGLLPGGEVEVGQTWKVDLPGLRDALAPGGNPSAVPEEDGFFARMYEVGVGGDLSDALDREISGTASATFTGVREQGAQRLAVIELDLSVSSVRDRTVAYLIGMPPEEKRESALLQQVQLTWLFDGTGELLWNIGAGHAHSLEIRGQEVVSVEAFKLSAEETGEPLTISQRSSYSGEMRYSLNLRKTRSEEEIESAREKKSKKDKKGR